MIYYTSDLHLGHENVIEMCRRPFSSITEMDEAIIENYNKRVHANDTVYFLGDLMFRNSCAPEEYLRRLKGKKILVLGNHDKTWIGKVTLSDYFEDVQRLLVINTGQGKATLCHFPMLDHEGRYLIHGHIHNNTDMGYWRYIARSERMLNAGVDVNGFAPVTIEELFENNARFKAEHMLDPVGKAAHNNRKEESK